MRPNPSRARPLTIFSALWQPMEGGAEKQFPQVSGAPIKFGWQVSVIAGGYCGLPSRDVTGSELHIRRVMPRFGSNGAGIPVKHDLFLQELTAAPATYPSIVLGSQVSGASHAAMTCGRFLRLPTVLRLGGDYLARTRRSVIGKAQGRHFVSSADVIVVNADHLKYQLAGFKTRPESNQDIEFCAIGRTGGCPDVPNVERRGWRDDVQVGLA